MPRAPRGYATTVGLASTGLTLRRHPLALVRNRLSSMGVRPARDLLEVRPQITVRVAGLVTCRQRPGTASGVIFVTLEDDTGYANVIVWPSVADRQRSALLQARLLFCQR